MNHSRSQSLFEHAKTYFPGGVNSPVRAFKSVGGTPVFMKKGSGAYVWDEDGNKYLDFCASWGPLLSGHAHPAITSKIKETVDLGTSFGTPTALENELAELILKNHRFVEKIRFVSSGTEAVMSAIRLARGITKKSKIIKFDGCYHGHADSLLVNAGSGLATLGIASSLGIPEAFSNETLVLPLNDEKSLENALKTHQNELACVIIEPIPANNGLLLQNKAFLSRLRELCTEHGVLLIFDEVISGFRIGFEGASGHYDIKPDIITFGKIIGGGLPVGAYGSSAKNMAFVSPEGGVYQAGTLSGNPVAMAAGIAQLQLCLKDGFYEDLHQKTAYLVEQLRDYAQKKNYPFFIYHIGSIFWFSFLNDRILHNSAEIKAESMTYFKTFYHALLDLGVYFGPSGYEVGFVSSVHTIADLDFAIEQIGEALDKTFAK